MDNTQTAWKFEYLREFEANTKNISGGESGLNWFLLVKPVKNKKSHANLPLIAVQSY